jgi:hypothetical protein
MTIQDPTVTRAELAIEEAELIDGGPAVSWGAIIAGALSAAALSFVLLAIGAAFGLSVTSPWDFTGRDAGEAAAAAGIGTAIFLIVVHAITSGVGGYLAGRLRSTRHRPRPGRLGGQRAHHHPDDRVPGDGDRPRRRGAWCGRPQRRRSGCRCRGAGLDG